MDYMRYGSDVISKMALGTAQLGMPYGIANKDGVVSESTSLGIIEKALTSGINCFDTAQVYGNSEDVLGSCFESLGKGGEVFISSKLSPSVDFTGREAIDVSIRSSLKRLRVDRLWCMMLHRAEWLSEWGKKLGSSLRRARDEGLVKYLGVSAYTVSSARSAIENPDIEIIQVPCNAWNQSMFLEGIFDLAKANNKLCLVRSVYHQGLLTMPVTEVAKRLPEAGKASERWHDICSALGMSEVELAMRFALSCDSVLIVGLENDCQLVNNIALVKQDPLDMDTILFVSKEMMPYLSERILDPSLW